MSELITDEMVEAAARAFYEAEEREVGTLEVHPWDGVIGERREAWRICARAALEAAAPLIAARALEVAADFLATKNLPRSSDSVDVVEWLRGTAKEAAR